MNRAPWFTWRLVYPATLLFFALSLLYALGVEIEFLGPLETRLRTLPMPRFVLTLLVYPLILLLSAVFYHFLGDLDRDSWLEQVAQNQGGGRVLDVILMLVVVGVLIIGWRYLNVVNAELLVFGAVALFAVIVSLIQQPGARVFFVQRAERDQLDPTLDGLLTRLGVDPNVPDEWAQALREMQTANPQLYYDVNTANPEDLLVPGDRWFVPPTIRPAPPVTDLIQVLEPEAEELTIEPALAIEEDQAEIVAEALVENGAAVDDGTDDDDNDDNELRV